MSHRYTRREMLRMSLTGAVGASLAGSVRDIAEAAAPSAQKPQSDPPIRTRVFWTWDHSTEWSLNHPGSQTMGASNYYSRGGQYFIEDYTKLLEWCGSHGVDAVVVWGLLRDVHGGTDSVKKLCDVANKKGVRLLAGVGLNAYGGVYYDGPSPYNLPRHLGEHPELVAVDANGNAMVGDYGIYGPLPSPRACPSRKENQQFAVQGLQWLFKTLPGLGGVQMETGDTGVCQCKLCKDRRQHAIGGFSWEDMALMYPMATEAIRSASKDAMIICETYSHPEPLSDDTAAMGFGQGRPVWSDEYLNKFPEGVFVQWAGDAYFKPQSTRKWTSAGNVSNKRHKHIMRAHYSTYWQYTRGELASDYIADQAQQSMAHGVGGLSIFGEVSPFNAGPELNYLAFENFGSKKNPKADLNMFLKHVAGPLLGGDGNAHDYLKYARLVSGNRSGIPAALGDICKRISKLEPDTARRWVWLANFLASSVYR